MSLLQSLLEEIKAGKRIFGPKGETATDIDMFQHIAEVLAAASQQGYLIGYYPMYASNQEDALCNLIMVERLGPMGESFLARQDKAERTHAGQGKSETA